MKSFKTTAFILSAKQIGCINKNDKTKALIFDSYFDPYRGVIVSVKVDTGTIKIKDK